MAINLLSLVDGAYRHNASDLHLVQDSPIFFRVDGIMRPVQGATTGKEDLEQILSQIMPSYVAEHLKTRRCSDFAWQPDDRMRFRVSAYYERDHLRLVMRLIKIKIATLDDLGLPPVFKTIAGWQRGLTLVTGVTGSGKSTTLGAILNEINQADSRCIITIEDPIELVHANARSVVSQREVGRDVEGFRPGLVQALRQDPDVILIGEMRDPETISTALRAAETGHYVFSTMHTSNALHTVNRILAEFEEVEHGLLREQLAHNLRATISQRLLRRKGGKGRVAALEIMIVNVTIAKLLLENQIPSIGTVIRERRDGMMLFDQHLADLVREEMIDEAEALLNVEDEFAFHRYVKGKLSSSDRGGIIG
ncbi:MAG: PilT/PilU family type 4a pilus ATPase [Candidatus Sumerlaeota bacterium]|nr:PilT/PilU family type 4a pilus ATPase [Candidatus Sumerlaeota bacterium]